VLVVDSGVPVPPDAVVAFLDRTDALHDENQVRGFFADLISTINKRLRSDNGSPRPPSLP
jgi:hypothetical protein